MAKEMFIVFVYDTEEQEDPASAILYFHPGWVSDQQRTSLCGQIVGTCHFLSTVFKRPKMYALQSGKFAIRTYGRYLLAVGTDRNVADWILQHRSDTLTSLIAFFHCDFNKLNALYPEAGGLSGKLYFTLETYLKILTYGGHMFYNVPTIQLPKSASHVFLECINFLQWCRQLNFVLGGTVLYHNKMVATQLPADVTKQVILTDPYRIKSPAEKASVDFATPLGVQLLNVYIDKSTYNDLVDDANAGRSSPKIVSKKPPKPMLSAMKRDQSIIFTTVPEEDGFVQKTPELPPRPVTLEFGQKPATTVFPAAKTSVCSTPMSELSKHLHPNIVSICLKPNERRVEHKQNLTNLIGHSVCNRKVRRSKSDCAISKRGFGRYRTIPDPLNPFFNVDGTAISQSLLAEYAILELAPRPISPIKPPSNLQKKARKKALSLPLKSLTNGEQPSQATGVQLTPLMAKLSLLSEDKSSGYCTPSTPSLTYPSSLRRQTSVVDEAKDSGGSVEVVLFVCGQQDMVVTLLLENVARNCPDVVNQLWEKSTESLGKLQRQLRHSLEAYQGGNGESSEPYSFMCTEPQWDTTQRGGPWGGGDLAVVTQLHSDFSRGNLTEIIVRNEESVVYGHCCGKTEVYYQQAAPNAGGLPTPADLMGTVGVKAKRKLERDHGIILL